MFVMAAVASVALGVTLGAAALGARWWGQYADTSRKPVAHATSRADHMATEAAVPAPSSSWKTWLGLVPHKTTAEASSRADRAAKTTTPAAPVLTFYHDLTAPLTPLPRPAKPTSSTPPPATPTASASPKPAPVVVATPPPSGASPAPRRDAPVDASPGGDAELRREAADPNGRRFTIQVGAYRTRETADALRTRLEGSGQDVYITESDGPEGVRYRVRVGAFATQEAARAAAARLAAERIPTYVTTR